MKKIVSLVIFLFLIKLGFAGGGNLGFEVGLERINLEGEATQWFETFGTNTLVHLYLESTQSIADVKAEVFEWGGSSIYEAFLRDDGSRGDITAGDGEWNCMFGGGLFKKDFALFEISFGPYSKVNLQDSFLGNDLSFGENGVWVENDNTPNPSLKWNSIEGADSYWVGIWRIDKDFEGDFGYVDLSERIAEYPGLKTTGIDLELPVGKYKWIVYADGEGGEGRDGGVAYGGTVTVTPEPAGSALSLIGLFSLFGAKNFRRKIFG